LKNLLAGIDRKTTLVLDLRSCAGGEMEEAGLVAKAFAGPGTLATVQEAGKPDRIVTVQAAEPLAFRRTGVLVGPGTLGAAEALASFFKKQAIPTIGDHTAALGVERARILLRQGGAVDLVTRRWVGSGGEKLDRQGVQPEFPLKALQPDEDPLPKVIEILDAKEKAPDKGKAGKVAGLPGRIAKPRSASTRPALREVEDREVV